MTPSEIAMRRIELFPPASQGIWGWPGIMNFLLGGAGTGFYLFTFMTQILEAGTDALSRPIPFRFLAPTLVVLGFLGLTIEAGRPLRSIHLLRRLGRSWISRETLSWSVFVPTALLDGLIPHPFFRVLALASAAALMMSQGFILFQIKAITAWHVSAVPVFFLSSGFASGAGVMLLAAAMTGSTIPPFSLGAILIGLGINLGVWLLYLHASRNAPFQEAMENERSLGSLVRTGGLGHLLPLALVFFLMEALPDIGTKISSAIQGISGLAVLGGILKQKGALVHHVSSMKRISIESSEAGEMFSSSTGGNR